MSRHRKAPRLRFLMPVADMMAFGCAPPAPSRLLIAVLSLDEAICVDARRAFYTFAPMITQRSSFSLHAECARCARYRAAPGEPRRRFSSHRHLTFRLTPGVAAGGTDAASRPLPRRLDAAFQLYRLRHYRRLLRVPRLLWPSQHDDACAYTYFYMYFAFYRRAVYGLARRRWKRSSARQPSLPLIFSRRLISCARAMRWRAPRARRCRLPCQVALFLVITSRRASSLAIRP